MANISLNICTKTSLSVHVSGHLGYSQVLAILNIAAINIGIHATFRIVVFSWFMPSIGMLGHMIVLFLVFRGNLHSVLHSGCIHLYSSSARAFPFLHILSSIYGL